MSVHLGLQVLRPRSPGKGDVSMQKVDTRRPPTVLRKRCPFCLPEKETCRVLNLYSLVFLDRRIYSLAHL